MLIFLFNVLGMLFIILICLGIVLGLAEWVYRENFVKLLRDIRSKMTYKNIDLQDALDRYRANVKAGKENVISPIEKEKFGKMIIKHWKKHEDK
jgi:uridine kinase